MNAWRIALDSIWHHKLRSSLTALGVVIGVFAVVTLASLGAGVRNYVTGQFNSFGAALLTVTPAPPGAQKSLDAAASGNRGGSARGSFGGGGGGGFGSTPSTLTVGDVQAILALKSAHVAAAAPVADAAALVANGNLDAPGATVVGTTAPYFAMSNLHFASGGVSAGFSTGAVLGQAAAAALFPSGGAVGSTVSVNGQAVPVVGVLAAAGSQLGGDPDQAVYVPVAQALSISGASTVSEILVRADGTAGVSAASAAIQAALALRHPLKDFAVVTAGQILSIIQSTLGVITSVLGGIAAISLLVGGIGIMNIMLVTVTERVHEIGTRKAMGARDSDILVQFLVESVLLALLGGVIGTACSGLAGSIVGHAVNVPLGLTASSVSLALVFSVAVGAVFGVLPALNAARLMPAVALRSE